MQIPILRSRVDFQAAVLAIKAPVAVNIPVSESHIREALARGHRKKTAAALFAALDAGESFPQVSFDRTAFVARLTELSGDPAMADAANVALDGVTLTVNITKRSPGRQRHDRWEEVAFDVEVLAGGLPVLEQVPFEVPASFASRAHAQPLRLASASAFKVDDGFAVTRNRDKRNLLSAKLVKGRWMGGMYVDLAPDDPDGARYVRSVRAALAREIMPALTPWVRCRIFRPDHFDYGAFRVEMSLGSAARGTLGKGRLVFNVPKHKFRLFQVDKGFMFDLKENGQVVGEFRDGVWRADLYSNGIQEDKNPVSIATLNADLLRNVHIAAGFVMQ